MKLKFLFLGMFAAAAMISCNNEVIDGPNGGKNKEVIEGIPVYASVNFNIFNGVTTFAGNDEVGASTDERAVRDAAMYVYKYDGVGTTPEAYVYVTSVTGNKITMKATSGRKKIFVAVNNGQASARLTPTPSASNPFTIIFDALPNALNNPLYSNSNTTWDLLPSTAIANNIYKADGLIRGLAMKDIYGTSAGTYSGTGDQLMLMTNWDGPKDELIPDDPAKTHLTSCEFVLSADVDSTTSSSATSPDTLKNAFNIYVQRAFAKVSLQITAQAGSQTFLTNDNFSSLKYKAGDATYSGEFQPWYSTAVGEAVWSLGNIHKETLPFQQFINGVINDLNYLAVDDSITNFFNKWTTRYDNTRIFPFSTTINSYPHNDLKVANVKAQMLTAGNNQQLTTSTATNFAFAIENARLHPVTQDYGTYVIIGGRYNPESIITDITRANIPSNPPTVTTATGYSKKLVLSDTMYYIPAEFTFILGKANLLAYYAWYKGRQPDADPTGVFNSGTPVPYHPVNIIDFVNKKIADKSIMVYAGGQCWYRIFIGDLNGAAEVKRALRRNHIYAVNITKILGPGIDDPNNILIPGKPIDDLDTYVTANIKILDWHKVDQAHEADMN